MKRKYKKRQKDEHSMIVVELEDGREHIMAKQNKPEKFNLKSRKDLDFLENFYREFIDEKIMGYTKDLQWIVMAKNNPNWASPMTPPNKSDIVFAKSYRIESYNDNLYIPYRTFSAFQPKK